MAPDFKSYLRTQIFVDKQMVSYRQVSRCLKVHVNAAKCMLYEFYEGENQKKPSSVYATFLISGTLKPAALVQHEKDESGDPDGPEALPSSPPPFTSSMVEPSQQNDNKVAITSIHRKTITLAREELLDNVKNQYDTITAIHIYSLSPGRIPDLVALTDADRDLYTNVSAKEDPLETYKIYGVISNPDVRRRKGKRPVIYEAPATKIPPANTKIAPGKDTKTNIPTPKPTETSKDVSRSSSKEITPAVQATKPTLKRDSSNLFKAFAKQQAKPKLQRTDTDTSTNASISGVEDAKMTDAEEEGESEDEALFLDTNTRKPATKKRPSDIRKEREDKTAKLRKMMDDDDAEETDDQNSETNTEADKSSKPQAEPSSQEKAADKKGQPEEEQVEWSESDGEKEKDSKKPEELSEPKRRRGRRQVTKKRTMKDEQGWLITKEEQVWESFSEDEPEQAKPKPKSAFSSMKSSSQKSSQPAASSGKKGNIKSFFGRM